MLDDAIEAVAKHSSIQADLRETVLMETSEFSASGTYAQASGNRIRMELQIHPIRAVATRRIEGGSDVVAPKAQPRTKNRKRNAVLHVSNGRILWTQWTMNGKPSVQRRDLGEITKALSGKGTWTADQLIADMGVGGVPALLQSLKSRMVFDGVKDEEIDGKPFVVIQGTWNDEQIARFMAPQQPRPDPVLKPHLPEYVRLYFEKKTMFPRRILYLKRHRNPERRIARPMVTLDFTRVVLNGEVNEDEFRFTGRAKDQVDVTDNIIKAMKEQAKVAEQIKTQQMNQKQP